MLGALEHEIREEGKALQDTQQSVVNDLTHSFTPGSREWRKLTKFTAELEISFISPPRRGRLCLVLDLDHTLLDFTGKDPNDIERMKRPYLEPFMEAVYQYYDLVIWSQTHWKWLEIAF